MVHTLIVMIISIIACRLVFAQISAGVAVEQRSQGTRPSAQLAESFDGLGFGFEGPQGKANLRNPSDNTIAVGPDHIVQIVNTIVTNFCDRSFPVIHGPPFGLMVITCRRVPATR